MKTPSFNSFPLTRRGLIATFGAAVGTTALSGTLAGKAFAADETQLSWALHFSPTSLFFDPGFTPGTGAPLVVQYAMHDALVRPVEGEATGLSLAEKMEEAEDGLSYTFTLREGLKFQNGDPLTAEDAKFSFDRYQGANEDIIREFVSEAQVIDPLTIKYVLSKPWPDFLAIFGTPASGVAWVLPKAYLESVGDDGFQKAPIGAGAYQMVKYSPGTEVVFEASEHYWRKKPEVQKLVFRVIPDAATRLASVRNGEVDFAYGIKGDLVTQAMEQPNLTVESAAIPVTNFCIFASIYDEDSPWSDVRVRRAAVMALDRDTINDVAYAGLGTVSNSIIPHVMDFYWEPPKIEYDPEGARALLAEAGYPNGFDGGDLHVSSDDELSELIQANLGMVGINMTLRPRERAAQLQVAMEKKLTGLILSGSGAAGNAASRLQQFVFSDGSLSYLHEDDLDAEIQQQSNILDVEERTAKLDEIQKRIFDEALFLPVIEFSFPIVYGPRVGVSGVNAIPGNPYTSPYEDLTIKS